LSIILDRAIDEDPLTESNLRASLKEKLGDRLFLGNLKGKCQERFGKAVYASAMILGAAYQSGKLPFSHSDLLGAFNRTMRSEDLKNNLEAFELGRELYHLKDSEEVSKIAGKSTAKVIRESLASSFMPWQSTKVILGVFDRNLETLKKYFPKVSNYHLAKYLHDILLYDRGAHLESFMKEAGSLGSLYNDDKLVLRALRTLARTYFIKDEVFVAHQMISPLMKHREKKLYLKLGKSFKTEHINRPHFDLFGFDIEFDINPKEWMLKIMRHMRIFRLILPSWHKKERFIASNIRKELLHSIPQLKGDELRRRLVEVENIKGYREVRYEQYEKVFGEKLS
jgi:indolepyruvate ferredoxin oxidoreductase